MGLDGVRETVAQEAPVLAVTVGQGNGEACGFQLSWGEFGTLWGASFVNGLCLVVGAWALEPGQLSSNPSFPSYQLSDLG